jgi:type IV pilus assembly protein PilP
MIKKLIIFNLIIVFCVATSLMLGCGEEKAKPKKASKAVSKKIAKAKKATKTKAPAKKGPTVASSMSSPLVLLGDTAYKPEGRIDPFAPLFREEEPAATPISSTKKASGKKVEHRPPTTPLEKVDLAQLKLKAILRTASGNKALVEEASGKGYIVKKGTYIGTRSGIVVAILKDRVIVEELIKDALGEGTIQEKELKLQKPLGEE